MIIGHPKGILFANSFDFIKKGQFSDVKATDKAKSRSFVLELKILDANITFEVWDDISYLKNKKRLHHVVAIFIDGSAYQFKNIKSVWKLDSIAKLFKKGRLRSKGLLPQVL